MDAGLAHIGASSTVKETDTNQMIMYDHKLWNVLQRSWHVPHSIMRADWRQEGLTWNLRTVGLTLGLQEAFQAFPRWEGAEWGEETGSRPVWGNHGASWGGHIKTMATMRTLGCRWRVLMGGRVAAMIIFSFLKDHSGCSVNNGLDRRQEWMWRDYCMVQAQEEVSWTRLVVVVMKGRKIISGSISVNKVNRTWWRFVHGCLRGIGGYELTELDWKMTERVFTSLLHYF